MKKDSFVAYAGWAESTETLSDAQAGQLFRAVFRYTATGEASAIDDPAVAMAFQFIRRDIDRDARLYIERCEANRENGRMGGRPKKAVGFQETEKSERFFEKPKKADNDNDNDNDNDIYIHSLTPRAREGDLKTFGTFGNVKLSDGDVEALRMAFSAEGLPDDFLDRAIERLSAFMAQEGRSYKNHRAAILGWVKTAVMEDDKKTGRPSRKPPAADPFEAERKVWASMSEEDRNEYLNTHGGKYPWQE